MPQHNADTSSAGEWLLIATFQGAGHPHSIIGYGNAPSIQPGDKGFQNLRRLNHPPAVIRRLITAPVDRAVRRKSGSVTDSTTDGVTLYSVTDPVISGTGHVHAVWVWIGATAVPTHDHVATGAWEWNLRDANAIRVIYGPNIPEIYGQNWTVGQPYPLHTSADTVWVSDMNEVGRLLENGTNGDRFALKGTTRRPPQDVGVSIRAATEIVETAEGRLWRGVTWDVTAFEPPQLDPQRLATSLLAQDAPGWTAIVYWVKSWASEPEKFPIQVFSWMGQKVMPGVWLDPITGRARVHPSCHGLPHRWAQTLETANELKTEIGLWGTDEQWHWLDLRFERIEGSQPAAATVRITRREGSAVDDAAAVS